MSAFYRSTCIVTYTVTSILWDTHAQAMPLYCTKHNGHRHGHTHNYSTQHLWHQPCAALLGQTYTHIGMLSVRRLHQLIQSVCRAFYLLH